MNTEDEKFNESNCDYEIRNESNDDSGGNGFLYCLAAFCIAMTMLSINNQNNPDSQVSQKTSSTGTSKISEFLMSLGFYPNDNNQKGNIFANSPKPNDFVNNNIEQNNYYNDYGYDNYYEDNGNDYYDDIEIYDFTYGQYLTPYDGYIYGPSGKETFYNLDMSYVCVLMQELGYYYDYWVREDGCKMYGPYIMVAADLRIRPKGTILETSLGTGMVCDTGLFTYMYYYPEEDCFVPSYISDPAYSSERIYDPESYVPRDDVYYPYSYQIDIATTW